MSDKKTEFGFEAKLDGTGIFAETYYKPNSASLVTITISGEKSDERGQKLVNLLIKHLSHESHQISASSKRQNGVTILEIRPSKFTEHQGNTYKETLAPQAVCEDINDAIGELEDLMHHKRLVFNAAIEQYLSVIDENRPVEFVPSEDHIKQQIAVKLNRKPLFDAINQGLGTAYLQKGYPFVKEAHKQVFDIITHEISQTFFDADTPASMNERNLRRTIMSALKKGYRENGVTDAESLSDQKLLPVAQSIIQTVRQAQGKITGLG